MAGRAGARRSPVPDDTVAPGPAGIATRDDLVAALDSLRRRTPDGTARQRVTLAAIASGTKIPVSTIHSYLSGRTLPPPEALDAMVWVLGVRGRDRGAWADALDRVQTSTRRSVSEPVRRTMGPPLRDFVGRGALLTEMSEQWRRAAGRSPLLLLTGAGGIGKSSLALEWAHRHAEDFPDGALQVDLGGFGQSEPMSTSRAQRLLLTGLGVPSGQLPTDPDELGALYQSMLSGRRMVVLLDNARDSSRVSALITSAPQVTTILTSRDTLRALAVAQGVTPIRVPLMDADEARVLLARASGASDQARLDEVAAICAGLPLALRLSADAVLAPTATPSEVREQMTLLVDGVDRGVRGVIESSLAVLSDEGRRLFTMLGSIPGHWVGREAAEVVAGTDQESTLDELTRLNLLEPRGEGWWRHDLVAEAAAELADADPAAPAARRRLLLFYNGLARALLGVSRYVLTDPGEGIAGMPEVPTDLALTLRDVEFAAMVSLADWGVDHGESLLSGHLLDALSAEARQHGGFEEFAPVAERLTRCEDAGSVARWMGWRALGRWAQFDGDTERQIEIYRAAAALPYGDDDRTRLWSRVCLGSALTLSDLEHHGEAIALLEDAIAACDELGYHRLAAMARNDLGADLLGTTSHITGIDLLEQAADSAEKAGIPSMAALPLANAARAARQQYQVSGEAGWLDRAQDYLDRSDAVAIDRGLGDRLIARMERVALLSQRGLGDEAVELGRAVLAEAERSGDAWNQREALQSLAEALERAGAPRQAVSFQEQVVARSTAMHDRLGEAVARLSLASMLAHAGETADAHQQLDLALRASEGLEISESFPNKVRVVSELIGATPPV